MKKLQKSLKLPILDNSTKFLEPYLHSVRDLVNIKRIIRIKGYKVPIDNAELIDASLTKYLAAGEYVMAIRTHSNAKSSHKKRSLENILIALAHELAHLKEWEHSIEHFKLELKILSKFTKVMTKLNIKDHSYNKY